ncbi:phage tail protein [Scandinavium sp. M-37]|uniref:phage tail-collar fiber domain-containing protein n=1 Tax=Scandinavium sp. M-37 TaxID=3373077 RepID=UPI003744B798
MTVKYKTVVTTAGAAKFAAALTPGGKKVNIVAMAVGDGGGTLPEPNTGQTKLINEVWRHPLNKISQDNKKKNYVVAELVIPPETGGFWLREMGLYDDTGTLVAVGNMAESYKPKLEEGSGRAQTLRMVIILSDLESVELAIDSSMVMATQDYVDDKIAEHEQSRRHPDATLKEKGFTQLSSATDSASEALAATPKAVKTAYDLAKGKYTAQDATTVQKGIVQLSSATDSTSETLAATPKAVKAANDNANGRVPGTRKVNGRALTGDISITVQDIFNGQAVSIGNAIDLNAYTTPGLYYQAANAQAVSGKNYPEPNAGSLEVYKHAGVTQIYRVYNHSRSYIRTMYSGAWSAWTKQYDAANKPTPADIGAVSKGGDTVTGTLKVAAEVQTTSSNSFRMVYGNYGSFWRQDGSNLYLMLTNSGDWYGGYNSLRPFSVNLTTGDVTINKLGLVNFANFDARYYTKAQSDAGYMPKTGAYTKAESDGRFQPKGSFGAPNSASKAANGWWQCGSTGIIEQWLQGATMTSEKTQAITFPKAFPSACLSISVSTLNVNNNTGTEGMFQLVSKTKTGCVVMANRAYGSVGQVAVLIHAVGY